MLNGCELVSEMFAEGFNLKRDIFSSKLKGGDHLLAPTGSDLARYNVGTVFAGFHYGKNIKKTMNFLFNINLFFLSF
jgi:hypothetical protein